jgi:hypothetical protein
MRKLTPGARAGLEPAPLVVNAGSGCSAAVKAEGAGDRRAGNHLVWKENREIRGTAQ